ncbi:6-phosphofructo-2-kinase/fructose-2,6-bisphosphatase 3 [Smittium mucronatum]|uniref:6-phosphofructo-2-kinase/fructose-2, 6-bisphosphatase 3 n=1 Tax=Smittium mucronatum TaxID=133383 RepID=A0A1R0H4D2_9FUNG|nr:6-phosphofructo-2-kinase/fructose-2,6-bisphosphatase 3 [Smittium mucronatum]
MNIHIQVRRIYLARDFDDLNAKGDGNELLNPNENAKYAKKLRTALMKRLKEIHPEDPADDDVTLRVWTAPNKSCVQAGIAFEEDKNVLVRKRMMLKQRDMGIYNGYKSQEIKESNPEEYEKQILNPYYHRYPMGEVCLLIIFSHYFFPLTTTV